MAFAPLFHRHPLTLLDGFVQIGYWAQPPVHTGNLLYVKAEFFDLFGQQDRMILCRSHVFAGTAGEQIAFKEQLFLRAIDGDGTVDLEDYGKVIASCYGEEPTQEIKDFLKEKYGFSV